MLLIIIIVLLICLLLLIYFHHKIVCNELDEIKFKICTWDNKKPNYSAVAYKDGSTLKYLDKTYNIACKSGESDLGDGLR